MSYDQVERELAKGTPAELLCATCPWDRLCVEPPTMTRADVDQRMAEAEARDKAKGDQFPTGMLLTALTVAGRESSGKLCPVFAMRLRSIDGRKVADGVRKLMREWGSSEIVEADR